MFDAGMLRAILNEINEYIGDGARVEKVYQPVRDEIDLLIHSTKARSSRRLCINAGSNSPRISLSDIAKENPQTAPMFCMLLRKHLAGARLVRAEQLGFERAARLCFDCYDEMGYETKRYIIAEVMGKYSNLIFLDSDDKIISALHIIDFTTSRLRQILPGMKYELPPAQDKADPLCETREGFLQRLAEFPSERQASKFISSSYLGISTQTANELAYRASGEYDTPLCDVNADKLCEEFLTFVYILQRNNYSPTIVIGKDGLPIDYSFMDVGYYGDSAKTEKMPDFASLIDRFFGERDRAERIRQRAADILRLLTNARARLEKKISVRREELAECAKGDTYKKQADLITANIYMIKRGMTSFEATDYTSDPPKNVTVELDSRLSPSQNAQRMYKYYNKAKSAATHLVTLIDEAQSELEYIDSVQAFLERAESEEDLTEIRSELYNSGYGSRLKNYTPPRQLKSRPMEFESDSGYRILCGRNNLQNELLTFRVAGKGDLWFHAKDVPGSHVILLCDGEEPSEKDYTQAAEIAAYYSKSNGPLVAVDYTRVKNVKKPSGAKPGYVIYKTNYTAYVEARLGLEQKK